MNRTAIRILLFVAGLLAAWVLWPLRSVFPDDYSRVVYDRNGEILRVTCAEDEQIRIGLGLDSLPQKYAIAVTTIEDKRFFQHPGVDPVAIGNALVTNLKKGTRVRGGSTIPMQVIRLSHPRPRTILSKVIEAFSAIRLSIYRSKRDIIRLYAGHVPMGGNIVGIESASRYCFGKPVEEITWAEAALFTVLPNNPSLINIERRRPALKRKRNRALTLLRDRGCIDSLTWSLACEEPLPDAESRLPFSAPHFSEAVLSFTEASVVHSTLDAGTQRIVQSVSGRYSSQYAEYGIHNVAVLALETGSGCIRGYVGSNDYSDTVHCGRVDGVRAVRSTGSLLKPLLAAKALDRGPWTMRTQLQDIPTFYGTFAPQNASEDFTGITTVEEMLIRSLNVPAVRLLYAYGQPQFYEDLIGMGFSDLFRNASGYGLSLILGGAEASLWELTRVYTALGNGGTARPLSFLQNGTSGGFGNRENAFLRADRADMNDSLRVCSPGSAWLVGRALRKLSRPGSEHYWQLFTDQIPVSWKTGTSYGQKDAWAIGVSPQWTIGVWVGNFTGEGNTRLSGAACAGPILFDLFRKLSDPTAPLEFEKPEYDLKRISVCAVSGLLPSSACPDTCDVYRPECAWKTDKCTRHRRVWIDSETGHEVCSRCWNEDTRTSESRVLYPPPVTEILRRKGESVHSIPPHNPSCTAVRTRRSSITIEYPVEGITIFAPRDFTGTTQKIVAKAAGSGSGPLYWYLNGGYLTETRKIHTTALQCSAGRHVLTVVDTEGGEEQVEFRVSTRGKGKTSVETE